MGSFSSGVTTFVMAWMLQTRCIALSLINKKTKMESRNALEKSEYEFILMFNKATGSDRIFYFMLDPRTKNRIYPKMNTTIFPKLRNLVGYRPVVLNNFLYIIGGKDWGSSDLMANTWKYNPHTNKWCACSSLNEPRCRFTADVLEGKIYVTGGEIKSGKVTDTVEIYDPETDTWSCSKNLPKPRVDHASCVCGNRLYVSGGISNLKHQCSNVFWVFDPLTQGWTEPCPNVVLPHEREKHLMVPVKNDLIHIMSGRGFDQEIFQEKDEPKVCSYSTKFDGEVRRQRCWDIDHPHMFHSRTNCGYVTLGRHIYIFGGKSYQKDKEILEVDYYDVKKRKWHTVFNLPSKYSYANVDCVKLKINVQNREFSFIDVQLYDNWILW